MSEIEIMNHQNIRKTPRRIQYNIHPKEDLEAKSQKYVNGYQIWNVPQLKVILDIWKPRKVGNSGQHNNDPHIKYYQIRTPKEQRRIWQPYKMEIFYKEIHKPHHQDHSGILVLFHKRGNTKADGSIPI